MPYSNINRVVLVGRLTRDPELRELSSGNAVCSLRLACNSRRRDADGEYHERPNYFDVSVFGPLGENVERYMRKGRQVAVDGRLEWREWEGADEARHQAVSVVADNVEFLGGAPGANGHGGEGHGGEGYSGEGGEGDPDALDPAGAFAGVGDDAF
ncbi:MAG: single-stranded DNA-binding protein [Solirubrobacterales bacterium]|nr:single-stranded DNA-binding protein [Solirubrobacterales bacterium]